MTQQALTVGVVGLGFGRAHIPAFQANGCRVVAVCQRDEAGAKAVADRYGVPHVFERRSERAAPDAHRARHAASGTAEAGDADPATTA